MPRFRRVAALLSTGGVLAVSVTVLGSHAQASPLNYNRLTTLQRRLVSGALAQALGPQTPPSSGLAAPNVAGVDRGDSADEAPTNPPPAGSFAPGSGVGTGGANYTPSRSGGCAARLGDNVKVNQNCENLTDADLQGRGQAQNETSIAVDQGDPSHLVASFNDYRRGDGNCYGAYSRDRGRSWQDTTIPMSFTRGGNFGGAARQYWQAGGDTSVAFDSKGNAYFSCQVFNRGAPTSSNPDQSSAFYVFRSTGNGGASWNFPGRPVQEAFNPAGKSDVALEDKQLMTVDDHQGSPFQDRVYVTYTEFKTDGTAYIYESYSADYGQHFSKRALVSTSSPYCTSAAGAPTVPSTCNTNQFSQPFTGPDGALYVAFANFNNTQAGTDNRNQMLLARSTDGGNSFGPLVKAGDYYDLPDCATYQGGKDAGRSCVPEKGSSSNSYFRATNYPSAAVNPTNPSQLVVTFGSYINQHSMEANGCVPAGTNPLTGGNRFTGVKTPGACNNDVLASVSNDGGATFTGTGTDPRQLLSVNQQPGQATTDQFWQWTAFARDGRLATSYYDRQYGSDESTGYSDVSLSGSWDLAQFGARRVTSGSMPPPTQFSGLFYGDYTGLAADTEAFPLWMDTRDPELFVCPNSASPGVPPRVCTAGASNAAVANDQDAFTATLGVPTR